MWFWHEAINLFSSTWLHFFLDIDPLGRPRFSSIMLLLALFWSLGIHSSKCPDFVIPARTNTSLYVLRVLSLFFGNLYPSTGTAWEFMILRVKRVNGCIATFLRKWIIRRSIILSMEAIFSHLKISFIDMWYSWQCHLVTPQRRLVNLLWHVLSFLQRSVDRAQESEPHRRILTGIAK